MGCADTEIKILNRIVRIDDRGLKYEADPRHVANVIPETEVTDLKSLKAPGAKIYDKEGGLVEHDEREEDNATGVFSQTARGQLAKSMGTAKDPLDAAKATRYTSSIARCNYRVPGRPDISFAVRELARNMANPGVEVWLQLPRLAK